MSSKVKITKLLVANRGEIAVRIFKTCKRLGIKTVAIFSEADKRALHTRSADEAVCVGPSEASASYLNVANVIEAIKNSGADAVHPGYGFLSENGAFSKAVADAGAVFLGPTLEQMEALGDKEQAKEKANGLKIPVLESQRVKSDKLPSLALPLMIKARAGGGGRGMRIVRTVEEFSAAVQSASREALSFFNDGTLFVERFIERARHVEVQLIGDGTGHVIAVGDRDCTVQRKHQKVLEEAPAFGLSVSLREKIHSDSERLLSSVSYRGAGTAEFLICGEEYFFLEVNTRLQVEHPVTEAVTGLDLVELQIKIGEGELIKKLLPTGVKTTGSAIELRLCAEKPHENFTPATGTIAELFSPINARFDCGFTALDTVSHYYDSLLGKIIVSGSSRAEAIEQAIKVLQSPIVLGVETNQRFLWQLLSHRDFASEIHFTRWIDTLKLPSPPSFASAVAAVSNPLDLKSSSLQRTGFPATESILRTTPSAGFAGAEVLLTGPLPPLFKTGRGSFLFFEGCSFAVSVSYPQLRLNTDSVRNPASGAGGLVVSPLPGKILEIKTSLGATVLAGEVLFILESMKMEHPIKSPFSGVVKRMCVASQQVVEAGMLIAEVSAV